MGITAKDVSNPRLNAIFIGLAFLWSLAVVALAVWHYWQSYTTTIEVVRSSANQSYSKDLVYRSWATGHGGVYAPITPETPPNPYLSDIPERDIITPSGKKLTLINPAYMARQAYELGKKEFGIIGHITSLNPIRAENAPDDWERKALQSFEQGEKEVLSIEPLGNETYLRLMRPLITLVGCLKCHETQGYRVGDVRGGISVSVPWAPFRETLRSKLLVVIPGYGGIWAIGILGLYIGRKRLQNHLHERDRIQEEFKDNARLLEFRDSIKAKLSQVSVDLQKSTTIEELARTFMSQIAPLTDAAYGVFYLMDEQTELLQAVGGYGWMEAEAKSRQFKIGQGLAGQCAREKKPLTLNNSEGSDIQIAWGGGHFDLRAILLQPILEQDKILGVIELGAPQPFTEEHRALLGELMPVVALNLLINRRNLTTQELLAKGQEQIAELGKARKATLNILEDLEVSRKETEATAHKMDAMSQAVNDAMVMIDGLGKVLFWNQAAERLFGYTAAEAIGMDFHAMVVSAEDQEKAHAGLRQFSATGEGVVFGATIQTTAINRAGLTFPVEVNLSSFELGKKWFAVGTVRDITERHRAEKELKQRMEEMERFSRLTIDREKKMIQLKEEINTLLEQTGKEKKYKIVS